MNFLLRTASYDWLFWLWNYGSLCLFLASLSLARVMQAGLLVCCCPGELLFGSGPRVLLPVSVLYQLVQELLLSVAEVF